MTTISDVSRSRLSLQALATVGLMAFSACGGPPSPWQGFDTQPDLLDSDLSVFKPDFANFCYTRAVAETDTSFLDTLVSRGLERWCSGPTDDASSASGTSWGLRRGEDLFLVERVIGSDHHELIFRRVTQKAALEGRKIPGWVAGERGDACPTCCGWSHLQ